MGLSTGLGAGRAGTRRGGDCADPPGHGCLAGYGGRDGRPYFLALLAEAYGKTGQAEKDFRAGRALAVVDKTGERRNEAELYRLKGELTLHSPKSKVQSPKSKKRLKSVF